MQMAKGTFGGNKCLLMVTTTKEIAGTKIIMDVPAIKRAKRIENGEVKTVLHKDEHGEVEIPVRFDANVDADWRGTEIRGAYVIE